MFYLLIVVLIVVVVTAIRFFVGGARSTPRARRDADDLMNPAHPLNPLNPASPLYPMAMGARASEQPPAADAPHHHTPDCQHPSHHHDSSLSGGDIGGTGSTESGSSHQGH